MKQLLTLTITLLVALSLTACGDDHKDHDHKDHDHKDHGHKDHSHKDETKDKGHDDDDEHGDPVDLGKAEIDGVGIAVTLYGEVEAGHESVFDVIVSGDTPNAVRAWVGVKSAQGSVKSKLDLEGDKFHGHCETSDPLPADSKVWIEVETSAGEKVTASFAIKP